MTKQLKFIGILLLLCSLNQHLTAQKVVVSLAGYKGVFLYMDNPIDVSVEHKYCKDVVVKVDHGIIKGEACSYVFQIYDSTIQSVTLTVGIKKNAKIRWVHEVTFFVRRGPEPSICFAGYCRELIEKSSIAFLPKITIDEENPFEPIYLESRRIKVINYTIKIYRNDTIIFAENNCPGSMLTKDTRMFIELEGISGDKIVLSDIVVSYENIANRKVSDRIYFLN